MCRAEFCAFSWVRLPRGQSPRRVCPVTILNRRCKWGRFNICHFCRLSTEMISNRKDVLIFYAGARANWICFYSPLDLYTHRSEIIWGILILLNKSSPAAGILVPMQSNYCRVFLPPNNSGNAWCGAKSGDDAVANEWLSFFCVRKSPWAVGKYSQQAKTPRERRRINQRAGRILI